MVRKEILNMDVGEYAGSEERKHDLSLNVNPLGPSTKAIESIRNISEENIGNYQHPDESLHEKIANEVGLENGDIVLTNGCDGALDVLSTVLFGEDVDVTIPVPSFPRYEFHARKMGASVRFLKPEDGQFHPSIDSMVEDDSDYIILGNPQNPGGERFDRGEVLRLVEGFDGTVVIDEALEFPGQSHAPHVDSGAIVSGSFSKITGLAGLRAGYIVGKDLTHIAKAVSPFQINAVAQEAITAALDDREHLERTEKTISKELSYLKHELDELGIRYSSSESLCLLLSLNNTLFQDRSGELVSRLGSEGVKVVDGEHFRGLVRNHIRISVRDRETNKAFITALEKVIEQEEH